MLSESMRQACLQEADGVALVRSAERQSGLGEVFTPTELVLEMLEQLPDDMWADGEPMLDPTCGNGQFIAAVAIVKREMGHNSVLASVYGVDLMPDNVADTKSRLLAIAGDTEANRAMVEQNIICADGLRYHYRFDGTPLYDDENDARHFGNLFG